MANLNSYGFVSYEDIANQRVAAGNVLVVDVAIRASVDEHNRQVTAAAVEMVERVTAPTRRYKIGGGGSLQPLDQWGNPRVVRDEGQYDVAFPIQGGGTAWGDNRISRAMMTVADADRYTLNALRRDADWMKRHMLAALLDNTSYTYLDPNDDIGTLTIQPLANGDAITYLKKDGTQAVDTHYYAQAAAIADATNPFPTLRTELNEHMDNEGPYVAYVASSLTTSIQGLSNFVDENDQDVDPGIMAPRLLRRIGRGFGDTVLGYVDGVYIVEWSVLPAGYGLVVARGATTPPLGMREYEAAELQGLFTENHSPDGNLQEYRFIRYAGFGALNRTAALVFQIGNGAYQIPTGYATPLPA